MIPNPLTRYSVSSVDLKLLSGKSVQVPKCNHLLFRWTGKPIVDTYGGKEVLNFNGEPVFAELAIRGALDEGGWDGVWVDTYRKAFRRAMPPSSCGLPPQAQELYERICLANGGKKRGWFDIFAWKGQDYLFVECKRRSKDSINDNQIGWIEAALNSGVPLDSLLICEWDFGWIDCRQSILETQADFDEFLRALEKAEQKDHK